MDLDISDIDSPNQNEADEEELTAAEVLQKLEEKSLWTFNSKRSDGEILLQAKITKAWQNEKLAPDLLESKSEIVECLLEQLTEMEENIKRANKRDLKVSIHRLELDRIRFILSSYLRCRLKKIEIHAPVFLEREKSRSEDEPSRLSPEEFAFAKELVGNFETHLKNVVLNHVPRNLQNLDMSATVHGPNLDKYVFLKVNKAEMGVIIEEETNDQNEDRVDLEEGSQFLMRYNPIAQLVQDGSVTLI